MRSIIAAAILGLSIITGAFIVAGSAHGGDTQHVILDTPCPARLVPPGGIGCLTEAPTPW